MIILGWALLPVLCFVLGACAVFNQPRYGKLPQRETKCTGWESVLPG